MKFAQHWEGVSIVSSLEAEALEAATLPRLLHLPVQIEVYSTRNSNISDASNIYAVGKDIDREVVPEEPDPMLVDLRGQYARKATALEALRTGKMVARVTIQARSLPTIARRREKLNNRVGEILACTNEQESI